MSEKEKAIALSGKNLEITITLAPNGQVYFHDLLPDLLPVAQALCPQNSDIEKRIQLAKQFNLGK